jgi:hypothetical protein
MLNFKQKRVSYNGIKLNLLWVLSKGAGGNLRTLTDETLEINI